MLNKTNTKKGESIMNKEKLSDWVFKKCKWHVGANIESFITINIPLDNSSLDSEHGKKYHNEDKNTKHYHWYFPRIGSWAYAEKRILNDLKKGIIKIEERI